MPCKGPLSTISFVKYGYRPDHRKEAMTEVLKSVALCRKKKTKIITDFKSPYPTLIKNSLPEVEHLCVKRIGTYPRTKTSRRQNQDDRMFTLNHTAAKIRHDLSRMARKVWVTTKKSERLQAHLDLYIAFNNGYSLT
jgi:LIF / OSM family